MIPRDVKKKLIHIANNEYTSKKPLTIQLLRVKSEKFLTVGGPLKVLSISRIGEIYYLIMATYEDHIYLLYYTRRGDPLGGKNLELTPKLLKEIMKATVVEFKRPK
ncbi:MAG: hypothetical protein ACFE91_10510 [Promethearchaeota archaeon]